MTPTPTPLRPSIRIDQTWRAVAGEWTFTGQVDPFGEPTDVVLEVGPAPGTARVFESEIPVDQGLTEPGPLSITTRDLPDLEDVCVRFSASNRAGTTVSTPLCFPRAMPSVARAAPTVEVDDRWTFAAGEWTFTARVDPGGEPADVVLEVGTGPAAGAEYGAEISVAEDMLEPGTLTITTRDVPPVDEACVRFTATNSIGAASSEPLCFRPDEPSPSPAASP